VRAFGDNLTRWGTPIVLIETGPYPSREPDTALIRMNHVALLTALDALATGRVRDADARRYETLPINRDALFFTLVTGARVVNGRGVPPFVADIGIGASRAVRRIGGVRQAVWVGRVEDLGDLRGFGAIETIDATGLMAAPLIGPMPDEGTVVALPPGSETGPAIAVGQPARLMLLAPQPDGTYRVARTIVFDQ
jgi:hypothetical protein